MTPSEKEEEVYRWYNIFHQMYGIASIFNIRQIYILTALQTGLKRKDIETLIRQKYGESIKER